MSNITNIPIPDDDSLSSVNNNSLLLIPDDNELPEQHDTDNIDNRTGVVELTSNDTLDNNNDNLSKPINRGDLESIKNENIATYTALTNIAQYRLVTLKIRYLSASEIRDLIRTIELDKINQKYGTNILLRRVYTVEYLSGFKIPSSDSGVILASAYSDFSNVIGIALNNAVTNSIVSVRLSGKVKNNSWNWDTNKGLFLGTEGKITQQPLDSFKVIIRVGYALSPTEIYLDFNDPIIKCP